MRYQVILDTVWDVLFEGSKSECENVIKAFTRYNNAKNIRLEEIEVPDVLSDETRDKILEELFDHILGTMFGDGLEGDYIRDGVYFEGLSNMSDKRLVEELESYLDSDELLVKAKAELSINTVIS